MVQITNNTQKEFCKKYLYVLSEEQFGLLEDQILNPYLIVQFSDAEIQELDSKLAKINDSNERLLKCSELNNKGSEEEDSGNLEKAKSYYEENIKLGYPATNSFDRLMIIYRREKNYENELRIINAYITTFTLENERIYNLSIGKQENTEYLQDIQNALATNAGFKNKAGWYIFSPYEISKYITRRQKVIDKINKLKNIT